jgi:predicted Zn finger-like uncharacterized protein
MRIRCERCQAEFDLDETQTRENGANFQCGVCDHVFAIDGAISLASDDARASYPQVPAVTREAPTGSSHLPNQGRLKIVVCLTVAAGVAFAGIKWQRSRAHAATQPSGGVATLQVSRRPASKPPEARPDPGAGFAAIERPAVPTKPNPPAQKPLVEALPSPPPPPEPEKPAAKEEQEPRVRTESYEKLVADGDRVLGHGASAKAKDLYQRALRLKPAGAQALAGLGFVALDRGQLPAAWELFKRALDAKTSFAPAVFGMAEIHRARGERALAVNSYQHYLKISPTGSEAAAARRQLDALQAEK